MANTITKKQFGVLSELYNYYNRKLFRDTPLPDCMVSLERSLQFEGAFLPNCWEDTNRAGTESNQPVHEIILNPFSMQRSAIEWHSTLCHEMCHLYIQARGIAPRSRDWHCRRWQACMQRIGLMPSHTGKPGGRKTGRNMSHYIIIGGEFEKAFNKISAKDIAKYNLPYQSLFGFRNISALIAAVENETEAAMAKEVAEKKGGKKCGYICNCGYKVWGKEGIPILCLKCNSVFSSISKTIKSDFQ